VNVLKIGILNGGGDCAGLNSVTRAVLKIASTHGIQVIGVKNGWAGLLEPDMQPLDCEDFDEAISAGGTLLGTSRTNPMKRERGLETIIETMKAWGIDTLIAVGGDDTLGVARELCRKGAKVIGVPKTIDNDLAGTDFSFGFFSAVDEAMHLIESLKTTGASHNRVMVVEVMGRDAGWISLYAGLAAGAHAIIIPEFPLVVDDVVEMVRKRKAEKKRGTVIVIAEGVALRQREVEKDEFGHELIAREAGDSNASYLARIIEGRTGAETRATVLGHTIRGTQPNAYDRVMTSRLGVHAAYAAIQGKSGIMVSIRGNEIVEVSLDEGTRKKYVDEKIWKDALELTVKGPGKKPGKGDIQLSD